MLKLIVTSLSNNRSYVSTLPLSDSMGWFSSLAYVIPVFTGLEEIPTYFYIFFKGVFRTYSLNNSCSRRRARLEAEGRLDVTLHCARNGNYEKLQCDSGVCWCADPKTGMTMPGTRAVPEGLWKFLPCYTVGEMGTQYLRECESASHAQMLIRQTLFTHGTTDVSFNNIQCDYDGSYGKYKVENGIASCMWRDGTKIASFQAGANLVGTMNCNCARDHKHFEEAELGFTLSCMGNGNYEKTQGFNGKIFCVDRDGFAVTGYFDSVIGLDCDPYYYYEIKEPLD